MGWTKKFKLKKKLPVIGICFILFLLFNYFLMYQLADVNNNIDGSWKFTLSNLRHTDQTLGKDVFFNYGPSFEKLNVFPTGNDSIFNFFIGNVLFLAILVSTFFVISFWMKKIKSVPRNKYYALIGVSILALSIYGIDTLFYALLFFSLLAVRYIKDYRVKTTILVGLEIFALYKFSFTFAFLMLLPLAFFALPKEISIKKSLIQLTSAILLFYALYCLITWNLSLAFFKYIYYGLINSIHYNEFMSLGYSINTFIVGAYVLAFLALVIIIFLLIYDKYKKLKNKNNIFNWSIPCVLLIGVAFFTLKQSVVRSDGHLLAFIPFIYVLIALLAYMSGGFIKIRSTLVPIIIFCMIGFTLNISLYNRLIGDTHSYLNSRMNIAKAAIVNNRLSYPSFKNKSRVNNQDIQGRSVETSKIEAELIKSVPRGSTIIVFGNTTVLAETLADNYIIRYMPFLQNYSAHPPQLFDNLYIETLKKNPSAYVFVEETEGSVNERFVAHELNNLFQYLRYNYTPVVKDVEHRQYILQLTGDKNEKCKPYGTQQAKEEVAISVPNVPLLGEQYLKMQAEINTPLSEKAISLLVKKPVYKIIIINTSGGRMDWRTTESTLEHGVAVKPLYLNYHDVNENTQFALDHIILSGGFTKNDQININYYICTFN